ncbi:hypothetical protein BV22DRAFT_1132212 [Leucogyrophana mollusca]|uniref:Uncharacterized protein n=1 Tax=Leucogyrophana mollusca TaxID=85980 RepID=A0ACB8B7R0_9AGAM|nr:hypothetical protein BV22DRAFT_1132212 [Leucogyrophana mollusca]
MHRYNQEHGSRAEHSDAFNASLKEGRFDDQASPSGSEDDGGYPVYPDAQKMELEVEGDPNASLTSQTLNNDGTPKRPMNAFMIFARRRRPQVSAENQSMRTGDISKILSREWNAMEMSEKQFYLDRAKELKDNFNAKYPDYVYRRRPNNSRKRRRTDNSLGIPLDQPIAGDSADDYATSPDYGDISPVDTVEAEEPMTGGSGQDDRYLSVAPNMAGQYDTIVPSQSRTSSYRTSESPSYGGLGATESRTTYFSPSHGRATPDGSMMPFVSSTQSRGLDSGVSHSQYPPYMSNSNRTQPSPYFTESSHAPDLWHPVGGSGRDDHSRGSHSTWVPSNHSSSTIMNDERHRAYSTQTAQHSWVGASPPESIGSRSTSGSHTPNYAFPTLNSPFYPGQSHVTESYHQQAPVHSFPSSSQHYGSMDQTTGGSVSGRHNAPFDSRAYPPASTMHPAYPPNSNQDVHAYHQQSRNIPLSLPLQSMSSYSHAQSVSPTSPAGSAVDPSASQLRYWPRDKSDNQ